MHRPVGARSFFGITTFVLMLWPLRALRALVHGRELPGFARVVLVRDPTDVLAVPFVALAWLSGRRTPRGILEVTRSSEAITRSSEAIRVQ